MFGVPGKGNSGVLTSSECETVNILISVNDVITMLLVSVTIIINVSLFFFDLTFFFVFFVYRMLRRTHGEVLVRTYR